VAVLPPVTGALRAPPLRLPGQGQAAAAAGARALAA
jgi:hypothetical protein